MQDVKATIAELERVIVQLGFKGTMINDQVSGRTLDEAEFLPFWKAAEQLRALILFHQGGETVISPRI
jgi:predicted TIM-barrel fold metal-dependent hydrolase